MQDNTGLVIKNEQKTTKIKMKVNINMLHEISLDLAISLQLTSHRTVNVMGFCRSIFK